MKTKITSFYKFYLSGWVLLIIAIFLFNLILIPGIIAQLLAVLVTIYIYRKPVVFEEEQGWLDIGTKVKVIRDPFQWLNHSALHLAIALDKLCNVLFSYLLDVIFTKEFIGTDDENWSCMDPYRFGNHRDTISEVIGRNKELGTLTRAGRALDWILEKIDPGHSEDSIE